MVVEPPATTRMEGTSGNLDPADRRALVAVAVQFFVNGALFASVIPRLPELRDRLALGVDDVGLMLSVAGGAGLLGSAAVGRVVDRFGTRWVIAGAGSAICASLIVVGLAPTWPVLLAGLIGMLVFDVLVDVSMNLQGSWLSARRPRPVMNRLHGLWSLGTLIGGLVASRASAAGIDVAAHVIAVAGLLFLAIVGVVRNLPSIDIVSASQVGSAGPNSPTETSTNSPTAASTPRGVGRLVLFALAGAFAIAIEGTSLNWAAFRITDDFDVDAGTGALGYVAVAGGMTIGRLVGDRLASGLGPDRLMRWSTMLAGLGLAAATLGSQPAISLAGYLATGFGAAAMLPALYDQAAQRPGRKGEGLGALTAGLRMAELALPIAVGALAATALSVGTSIAIVALPSVVGFLIVTALLRRS